MVDTYDLFKRLSSGAKFSTKRSLGNVETLESSTGEVVDPKNVIQALDFFGTSNPKREEGTPNAAVKRKTAPRRNSDKLQEISWTETKESVPGEGTPKSMKKKKTKKFGKDAESLLLNSKVDVFTKQTSAESVVNDNSGQVMKSDKMLKIRQQKMNVIRKQNHIHVDGSDIPDPVESFHQLQKRFNFAPYIIENVNTRGYARPTPIQMQAVPLMIHKREVLCCAPTGSGKTAAYILPILHHLKSSKKGGLRALVVSPTRELANQIYQEFCRLSNGCMFRIHLLTKARSKNFGTKSNQSFDILVTTPNRLVHLLSQDVPGIQLNNVEWLVLDEADKLFEEGKESFKEQIATIYQACDKPDVKRALFSATVSNGIEEWAKLHLDNVVKVTVGIRNTATDTVEQELLFVGQEHGKLLAVRDIVQKGFQPPMLVFVQSKERAKELFHELIYDGINVDVIHSEKTQVQRDNVVKCFRSGKIWVLIATELMSRGIDFKGVNLVINYDFPTSAVAYIHRIGRTGRAGRPGKAITFFTEDDATNLRSIANVMKSSGCDIPEWMLKLKKPDRKTQKKLSKVPPARAAINTASKDDIQKAKRKRELIESSKKKKKVKSVHNEDD